MEFVKYFQSEPIDHTGAQFLSKKKTVTQQTAPRPPRRQCVPGVRLWLKTAGFRHAEEFLHKRGAISPERDENCRWAGSRIERSGLVRLERWSGGSEHSRERGAKILTAQLRSHALLPTRQLFKFLKAGFIFVILQIQEHNFVVQISHSF